MITVNNLPALAYDVAVCGGSGLDEAAGPACFVLGVVAGVFINERIH